MAVIGGGTTGIEVAEYLALQGKNITVIEIENLVAAGVSPLRRPFILKKLSDLGIELFTGAKYLLIGDGFIEAELKSTS